jgi:Na+-transporting NADH:ubiquinone oxidoreductase subunit NqrD
MSADDRRMATDRCAYLSAVAIANRLDEVWMAPNPVLFILYLSQYLPSLFRRYIRTVRILIRLLLLRSYIIILQLFFSIRSTPSNEIEGQPRRQCEKS